MKLRTREVPRWSVRSVHLVVTQSRPRSASTWFAGGMWKVYKEIKRAGETFRKRLCARRNYLHFHIRMNDWKCRYYGTFNVGRYNRVSNFWSIGKSRFMRNAMFPRARSNKIILHLRAALFAKYFNIGYFFFFSEFVRKSFTRLVSDDTHLLFTVISDSHRFFRSHFAREFSRLTF